MLSNRLLRQVAVCVLAAVAFAIPVEAEARETYPGVIDQTLKMDCSPPCMLCHTRPTGGSNYLQTVGIYFDLFSVRGGRAPLDDNQLREALAKLEHDPCPVATDVNSNTKPCDADGDGMGDIKELRANRDPNVEGEGLRNCVSYGCFARIAPREQEHPFGALALGLLFVAALLRLRSRGRSEPA